MIEGSAAGERTKKLTYGMVGGGQGAFIGDVHRKSIALDGKAELVAGCFSRDHQNTLATGKMLGMDEDRLYASFEEMMAAEGQRKDKIDFVVIVTPNNSHFAIAKSAMENGIHVACDKPLTTDSGDAEKLARQSIDKDLLFCVTYTYTGYPVVKHLREMIAKGDLGDIRFVGLRVRIYGTKGSIEWSQEDPNYAKVCDLEKPTVTISRGRDDLYPHAQDYSRIPAGHPEGYFEAFANIYSTFCDALGKKLAGESLTAEEMDFQGVAEGVQGVRFIEKCVESSKNGVIWVDF